MSYLIKKRRNFRQRWLQRCHKLFQLFLILTFLFGFSWLVLMLSYRRIAVPDRLLSQLNKSLQQQGIEADFGEVILDPRGRLIIEQVDLDFIETQEPFIRNASIIVDTDLPAWIIHGIPFDNIRIANADLYCPAMASRSGTAFPIIQGLNLAISKNWGTWKIDQFTSRIQNIDIQVAGEVTPWLKLILNGSPEQGSGKPSDLYTSYTRSMRKIVDAIHYTEDWDNLTLHIAFISEGPNHWELTADLLSSGGKWKDLLTAQSLHARTHIRLMPDIDLPEPIQLDIGSIHLSQPDIRIEGIRSQLHTLQQLQEQTSLFPLQAEATIHEIAAFGETISDINFEAILANLREADLTLQARFWDGGARAQGHLIIPDQSFQGNVDLAVDLGHILKRPELDNLWKLRWTKLHQPLFANLKVDYPGKLEDLHVAFSAGTEDIDILATPFQLVRLRGELNGLHASIPYMRAFAWGNDLTCTYDQDFTDPFYRFTLVGNFRPHDIDHWWRPWWKNTFDYIELHGELPWLDLSMRNGWIFKKQFSMFGYVEGRDAAIRGLECDYASAMLFLRPNYIDAFQLDIRRPEGSGSGEFQRRMVNSELREVAVDVETTMDLAPTAAIFGDGGLTILEPYTWHGNPHIAMSGSFYFNPDGNWQDIAFTIDTDQPMTYYNFPLDSLHTRGSYRKGDVELSEVRFGLCEGEGIGQASFLRQQDDAFILFDFRVINALFGDTLDRVHNFRREEGDPPEKKKNYEGWLNLHVTGITPSGHGLEQVFSQGHFQITEANLTEIDLLGPLSRLVPFTTLRLNDMGGEFDWRGAVIEFPKILATSKTARLEASGLYYTSDGGLQFTVKTFPLEEAGIPIVSDFFMPLLNPVTAAATVNLKGTLDEPQWRFALSPLNLGDKKREAPELDPEGSPIYDFRK